MLRACSPSPRAHAQIRCVNGLLAARPAAFSHRVLPTRVTSCRAGTKTMVQRAAANQGGARACVR
eukprot:1573868-Pleurochrysis_carterae.AAC.1